jgi:hypothetical protein
MFSGLKLNAGRVRAAAPEVGRSVPPVESTPARPLTEWERQQERMEGLVAGYARAWMDTERMRLVSLPVLPHQEQALQAAERALEAFGSGVGRDVQTVLEATPSLVRGIETKEGRQALAAAVTQVQRDREDLDRRVQEARAAAAAQAQRDRLALDQRVREAVRGWDALERAHDQAAGRYDWDAARAVTQRLEAYAQALKQDPQLEGALRTRGAEFGVEQGSRLDRVVQAPEVTERLMRLVGLEQPRGRDHGPSMGM